MGYKSALFKTYTVHKQILKGRLYMTKLLSTGDLYKFLIPQKTFKTSCVLRNLLKVLFSPKLPHLPIHITKHEGHMQNSMTYIFFSFFTPSLNNNFVYLPKRYKNNSYNNNNNSDKKIQTQTTQLFSESFVISQKFSNGWALTKKCHNKWKINDRPNF